MELKDAWDFVVKYYPKYESCSEIAENNDLQCIIDGEIEEGSCAESLYNSIADDCELPHVYPHPVIINEAERRLIESNEDIYRRAINGYIETLQ